jgi:hypothetical protein
MKFVRHPTNNHTYGAPENWDHSKATCDALPVTVGNDPAFGVNIKSFWKPTEEELELLNAGRTVCLTIVGSGMPPVALSVDDL